MNFLHIQFCEYQVFVQFICNVKQPEVFGTIIELTKGKPRFKLQISICRILNQGNKFLEGQFPTIAKV